MKELERAGHKNPGRWLEVRTSETRVQTDDRIRAMFAGRSKADNETYCRKSLELLGGAQTSDVRTEELYEF